MSLKNIWEKVKLTLALIAGLGLVLALVGGIAEAMRQQIFLSLLEDAWPSVRPGDSGVQIYRLSWPDGMKLTLNGDTDSRLSVGGMHIIFGDEPTASFDSGCGSFCRHAFVLERLTCSAPKLFAGFDATTCEFHMWEADTGERTCFFSLEKSIGEKYVLPESTRALLGIPSDQPELSTIGLESRPPDIYIDCPSGVLAYHW